MRKPRYTTNLFTNFVFNSSLYHLVMLNLTKNLPASKPPRLAMHLISPSGWETRMNPLFGAI